MWSHRKGEGLDIKTYVNVLSSHGHDSVRHFLHLHAVWVLELQVLVEQLEDRLVVGSTAFLQHVHKQRQYLQESTFASATGLFHILILVWG